MIPLKFPLFLLFSTGLFLPLAQGGDAAIPNAAFEAAGSPVAGWKITGDGSLDEKEKVEGARALVLRRDPVNLPATSAISESFPITPGVWELSGAYANDLYSPDVSFNVSVGIQTFDESGKALKQRRLLAVSNKNAWTHFKERLDIPAGAASAVVKVEFNKTHGDFRLDALALKYIGASIPMEGGDRKVIFQTNRVGNLFYPGDSARLEMTLETPAQLSGDALRVDWQVTDFYAAPASAPGQSPLVSAGKTARGWNLYRAVLDLSTLPLKVGPYYELRTSVNLGASSPARDTASFAILPEAASKQLDPLASPFGAHTWNATVYEYFPLAARLGIRRALVFWGWPEKPPYTPLFAKDKGDGYLRRIGWPKRFGIAPYGVLYPIMNIEHREGVDYSDEALREGIRQSIEKFKGDGLWGFQIGNEPPAFNPEMVKRDVEAYKVAYEAIKKTDPNFVVIGTAVGASEEFFKAGFQAYQDAYNVHAYSDLGELRLAMKKYQQLFDKYGGKKPIWSTEIGSKSQGLPRDVIARDIIRKAVCFFADGGGFFTWFAVGGMPDPEGERAGSYSDSMDLFGSKFGMHLPRLDAVAFYHLINILGAKTFVTELEYPDGLHGFLFRDKQANSLFVFWKDAGGKDVFVQMPGIHEVALTWMNGATRQLEANGQGINLRIGEDPVFLAFRSDETELPKELGAPGSVKIEALPEVLTQGETAEVKVRVGDRQSLQLSGPEPWKIEAAVETPNPDGSRLLTYRIPVPGDTTARAATFTLSDETVTTAGDTELRFSIPVKSKIEVDVLPVAGAKEGDAAIRVRLSNHSDTAQPVNWKAEILNELPMAGGTYRVTDAKPSSAFFQGVAADKLTLKPRETWEIILPMGGTDRQTIYKIRAEATDSTGNVVPRERSVGGFARAVRVSGKPAAEAWAKAPVYLLNEARQFCIPRGTSRPWEGEKDLSGTMQFLWDDQNLYVRSEVVDNVFANPKDDESLWNQDGLQFLFDPYRGELQSRGRYDYSMGLGQKGLQAWRHMSASPGIKAGPAPEIQLTVTPASKDNGNRTYEVTIPWAQLAPFQPKVGGDLGTTMIINEDDGEGRKSTIGWYGGVHLKEAAFVGDLILAE
ncbi:MAG TPA: sugar-binding protein [Chthoniobacterales bacterium]